MNEPHVDFAMQLDFYPAENYVEGLIFSLLSDISDKVENVEMDPVGSLIVLGSFEYGAVPGMSQMKPQSNPVDRVIVMSDANAFNKIIEYSKSPYDGAIVVNKTGQIIGAGIYLVVDNPQLEIPDDCGTRHKSAASFSLRNDVISVITLSEETNKVRLWVDGHVVKSR